VAASKFTLEHRVAFYEAIARGSSIEIAAGEIGVRHATVKGWLKRGRAGEADFAEFALVVDALRAVEQSSAPLTAAELLEQVSKSARRGSVAAQKLAWEILRNGDDGNPPGETRDPLSSVDEIAERRATRNG
jgi:hypothetical protein